MRKAALVLTLLALSVVGCGGSGSARARDAVRHVIASLHGETPWRLFPSAPASVRCQIPAGGAVTTLKAGTCSTRVAVGKDGSAVVRFVETWDAGSYTLEYSVSRNGRVTGARAYGQTPPQDAV